MGGVDKVRLILALGFGGGGGLLVGGAVLVGGSGRGFLGGRIGFLLEPVLDELSAEEMSVVVKDLTIDCLGGGGGRLFLLFPLLLPLLVSLLMLAESTSSLKSISRSGDLDIAMRRYLSERVALSDLTRELVTVLSLLPSFLIEQLKLVR